MDAPMPAMEDCIRACRDCHAICLRTAMNHCLEVGGPHVAPPHFRVMLGCAELCNCCANLMMMNTAGHAALCNCCAVICKECAESCRKLEGMAQCAQACLWCAQTCEKMARMQ